jgi:hypothetical protein
MVLQPRLCFQEYGPMSSFGLNWVTLDQGSGPQLPKKDVELFCAESAAAKCFCNVGFAQANFPSRGMDFVHRLQET